MVKKTFSDQNRGIVSRFDELPLDHRDRFRGPGPKSPRRQGLDPSGIERIGEKPEFELPPEEERVQRGEQLRPPVEEGLEVSREGEEGPSPEVPSPKVQPEKVREPKVEATPEGLTTEAAKLVESDPARAIELLGEAQGGGNEEEQ